MVAGDDFQDRISDCDNGEARALEAVASKGGVFGLLGVLGVIVAATGVAGMTGTLSSVTMGAGVGSSVMMAS